MTTRFRFEHANRAARAFMAPLLLGTAVVAVGLPQAAMAGSDRNVSKARDALEDSKGERAVRYAEKAVLDAPRDATRRALLGRAYIEAGRMRSARQALFDAVELGDDSPRTALMLALAQIGSGDTFGAASTLNTRGDRIPAGERGLAFALSGQTARGVEMIAAAIRSGENNARIRQNLAYAFALDGRWRESRQMAMQDVPANMIDDRITEWAMTAGPDQAPQRVAAMLGVELDSDVGVPAELALGNFPAVPAPVYAAAAPAPEIENEPVVEVAEAQAQAESPEVEVATAEPEAEAALETTEPRMVSIAVIQPAASTAAKAEPVQAEPAARASTKVAVAPKPATTAAAPTLPTPGASGTHVAQLGSYSSEANARNGWKVFQSRYANLKGQQPVVTKVSVDGKDYFRVSAGGFDAKSAVQMCRAVKASGHGCLAIAKSSMEPASSKVRVATVD